MGQFTFTRSATSRAARDDVWPLVAEASRWKDWSFLTRSGVERQGDPAPDGVGAIRKFTCLGIGSREEVVAWVPPGHLSYTIVSGFPVRHYRADVTLESLPHGGTVITWAVTFDPIFRGAGGITRFVLQRLIGHFVSRVARYADQHFAPPQ